MSNGKFATRADVGKAFEVSRCDSRNAVALCTVEFPEPGMAVPEVVGMISEQRILNHDIVFPRIGRTTTEVIDGELECETPWVTTRKVAGGKRELAVQWRCDRPGGKRAGHKTAHLCRTAFDLQRVHRTPRE